MIFSLSFELLPLGGILIALSTILASLQSDTVVTILGIVAGLALGLVGIYTHIDDKRHEKIKERLEEEEKEHDKTRELLREYKETFGPIHVR